MIGAVESPHNRDFPAVPQFSGGPDQELRDFSTGLFEIAAVTAVLISAMSVTITRGISNARV